MEPFSSAVGPSRVDRTRSCRPTRTTCNEQMNGAPAEIEQSADSSRRVTKPKSAAAGPQSAKHVKLFCDPSIGDTICHITFPGLAVAIHRTNERACTDQTSPVRIPEPSGFPMTTGTSTNVTPPRCLPRIRPFSTWWFSSPLDVLGRESPNEPVSSSIRRQQP